MLKEILAVSGKPGLYKLVSRGNNLQIIESLTDKKRIPAYASDRVIALGDISIFTDDGELSLGKVFASIKEKEEGKCSSIDLLKAETNELRAYLAEIVPNFDRERVYPSDIKKLLKWYNILIDYGITDFSTKEEEKEVVEAVKDENENPEEGKATQKAATPLNTPKAAAPAKRKGISATSAKSTITPKTKPASVIPKKSTVGAKRGS